MKDGIYNSIKDPKALASVTVDFVPIKDSRTGDLLAKFDLVIGTTPAA
jgi:protocatechuate 3,4-dioxygenase beta subunit